MRKIFIPILISVVGLIIVVDAKTNKSVEPNCSQRTTAKALESNTRQTMPQDGVFTLIELPYSIDALAPVISRQTMELHYGKHLKGYVDKLNALLKGSEYKGASLEDIVSRADGALFDNAGQTLNHNLFFTQFSPKARKLTKGSRLHSAICDKWGSEEAFCKAFTDAGAAIFGSGWIWLAANEDGELSIEPMANGSNPVAEGLIPLLGFDVWEHAYYLDYQNRRRDHLDKLWLIVDWPTVEQRYKEIINK